MELEGDNKRQEDTSTTSRFGLEWALPGMLCGWSGVVRHVFFLAIWGTLSSSFPSSSKVTTCSFLTFLGSAQRLVSCISFLLILSMARRFSGNLALPLIFKFWGHDSDGRASMMFWRNGLSRLQAFIIINRQFLLFLWRLGCLTDVRRMKDKFEETKEIKKVIWTCFSLLWDALISLFFLLFFLEGPTVEEMLSRFQPWEVKTNVSEF